VVRTGGPSGRATYEAAPNIALVKYWGLRDPGLGLPYNSSLSMTLDRLRTRTSVVFDPELDDDEFVLNGRKLNGGAQRDVAAFLDRVRDAANSRTHARVRSDNTFPTASGLASSASGFAALAGAASGALGLKLTPRQLSALARRGSGSASRSVFGGFVEWRAGRRPDGRDCFAVPRFGPRHWGALVDLVTLVRHAPEKSVRSQDAMQRTVATSPEYGERLRRVPRRLDAIRTALRQRRADRLFPLICEECDEFRRVCETTDPPLDYLVPASHRVIETVRALNEESDSPVAAYTHDAGAHVHVFTLSPYAPHVRSALARVSGVERIFPLRAGPGLRRIVG
jgi:diphosphomevalonate decarboxylase